MSGVIHVLFYYFIGIIIYVNSEAVYKTIPFGNTALIRVYPCNGTKVVTEWFNWRDQTRDINEYKLVIDLKNYEHGPTLMKGSNITIKFNKDANIKISENVGKIIKTNEDSYVLNINESQNNSISMNVHEIPGNYLPDVLSLKIDAIEQCTEHVELGIWNDYIIGGDEISTTSQKPIDDSKKLNCGMKQIRHTELITNALKTKPGDWPWHAALYKTQTSLSTQSYICGGTLINPSTVLTAGHCVTEHGAKINSNRLFVILGKYNLVGEDGETQEKSVYDIIVHQDFVSGNLSNDIALVKLATDVRYTAYVQPICLWRTEKVAKSNIYGKHGSVAGWGFRENNALSSQLLQASMPVVDELTCLRSYSVFYERYLTQDTFCAGARNGTSVCNGDSGGGMYFSEIDGRNERWFIRGITSVSVSKVNERVCDPNYYVIFTDVANYLEWIIKNL